MINLRETVFVTLYFHLLPYFAANLWPDTVECRYSSQGETLWMCECRSASDDGAACGHSSLIRRHVSVTVDV